MSIAHRSSSSGTWLPMDFQMAVTALLLLSAVLMINPTRADLNATETVALLALKTTQPMVGACAKLTAWGRATDGCEWPGVTCTPVEIGRKGGQIRRVQVLDLRYCGLATLPGATLQALEALEVLEVRGNAITSLPPEVGKLVSMRRIMIELNLLR